MIKKAWVLRIKESVSSETLDGAPHYLSNSDATNFLTKDLNQAIIIDDKSEYIEILKIHDEKMIEEFGEHCIRNFGWENISKNFVFVEVEVEQRVHL